ncbi:hypothetical protein ACFW04_014805 [Cataglyphis niger]
MICLETQYFNMNRILLLAVGLWPYQQSNLTRLQFIFFFTILTTNVIFQCTSFISQKCTSDFIVKILSSVSIYVVVMIKYIMFCVNIETIKDLLEHLQHVCNKLEENEFAIINEYGCSAKRYTAALMICAICSLSAFIVSEFWSRILDIILPMNVSRSHSLPFTMEYFVDQETYFYYILLHINVSSCIGMTVTVGIGTTLIAYFQYTCGMIRISSYRIKYAMHVDTLKNNKLKNEILILQRIISAIDIHRQAIKLIFQIASYADNVMEILFPFVFVIISVLYMFVANYVAQNLTDHNNDFFATVYDVQWYEAPLHIQKLILFLLLKGSKKFTVSIGGLFVGSLECFATLVKTSVSYFTVIYSMQE